MRRDMKNVMGGAGVMSPMKVRQSASDRICTISSALSASDEKSVVTAVLQMRGHGGLGQVARSRSRVGSYAGMQAPSDRGPTLGCCRGRDAAGTVRR